MNKNRDKIENIANLLYNISTKGIYYEIDLSNCKKSSDGKSYIVVLANSKNSQGYIGITNIKVKGYEVSYPDIIK